MLCMSACGLAVGVGLDELLDPPSPAHPISSNEKEQVETNLRTTDELSDMETPRPWSSSARTSEDQTEGCDTVWFFRGCPSCWIPHSFDSEEAANELAHKTALICSALNCRCGAQRRPLQESWRSSDSNYPEGTPNVQGMFTGCVGGEGGVAHGPVVVEKSKNSVISGMAASRAVRLGKWKRVSTSLSAAV